MCFFTHRTHENPKETDEDDVMKIFSSPASAWLTFNENSKIQVGDSIPERLQSGFSRSLVEVAGELNHGKDRHHR